MHNIIIFEEEVNSYGIQFLDTYSYNAVSKLLKLHEQADLP